MYIPSEIANRKYLISVSNMDSAEDFNIQIYLHRINSFPLGLSLDE